MKKSKVTCALSAVAMTLGSGVFAPAVWADGDCLPTELATEGYVANAAELEYAIQNGISEIKIANDFAIECHPSIMSDSLKIDLNGKTVEANVPWALDIEAADKTLTIEDSGEGGTIRFNDAGIWVQDGANLTINSGTVSVPEGRGRGIVFRDGVLTLAGGVVTANNGSYESNGKTFYYPTVVVLKDSGNPTVNITGGEIRATNGTALSVDGAVASMSGNKIYGGDTGIEVSGGARFAMSSGSVDASTWAVTAFGESEFIMNGGTLTATGLDSIGVSGNGVNTGTKLTLNAGTINSGDLGVYAPQIDGLTTLGKDLTINAGKCGVEVRAGSLAVNGATIAVPADAEYAFNPNGNGSTASGVAIAVAQHTTKRPINVVVNGGNFTAPVAFGESNPQHNPGEDVEKVSLSIVGGTFNATNGDPIVSSEDVTGFVAGGSYNKDLDSRYVAEGYVSAFDFVDSSYKVVNPSHMEDPNSEVDYYVDEETGEKMSYIAPVIVDYKDDYFEELYDGEHAVSVDINKELIADRKASLVVDVKDDLSGFKLNGGGKLFGVIDLKIQDRDGNEIEVEDNDLTVYIDIDEETYNELAQYDKVEVVYFNDEGDEVERLAAELKHEDDAYWVEFKTSHLSTYGIVGVDEAASPETGTKTAAGASASVAAMATAIAVGVLTSIVSFAYLVRRKD